MSYFHKVPPAVELREEVLKAADKYFEENELNVSSLSLLTMMLPEKKPLKNYPAFNNFTYLCYIISSLASAPCQGEDSSECLEIAGLSYPLLVTFPCWCWLSCAALQDERMKNSIHSRGDLVRLCISVYREGVFIYRRKLEKMRCKWTCFCVLGLTDFNDGYEAREAISNFVSWEDINMERNPRPMNFSCDPEKFVSFKLGKENVNTRREVYDILSKYYRERKAENEG
eukprot:snap_masked-scaffold_56-processed-gene-1.18-mRNA-1 protein AED:1.00 eAED:1.00 QI:0/-1/0/0/-1/1/1/0/227